MYDLWTSFLIIYVLFPYESQHLDSEREIFSINGGGI